MSELTSVSKELMDLGWEEKERERKKTFLFLAGPSKSADPRGHVLALSLYIC